MDPALGAVGRVTRANPALLDLLTGATVTCRWWPASPATARATSTTSMPTRWRWPAPPPSAPSKLIFLTDVEGVLDGAKTGPAAAHRGREPPADRGRRRHRRHAGQTQRRFSALDAGRGSRCVIAPGALPRRAGQHSRNEPVGTRLVAAEAQKA